MTPGARIAVLIVDDSSLARSMLQSILEADPSLRVVGHARTGREAVLLAKDLRPDVVTMDLEMPEMHGLDAIEQIMDKSPVPILAVTGDPRFQGVAAVFEAGVRGAIDLVAKPSTEEEWAALVRLIKVLAGVPVVRRPARRPSSAALPGGHLEGVPGGAELVVIGASTGGPGALRQVLEPLPRDFAAPVVVVQHLGDQFARGLIAWLGAHTALSVREAVPGARLLRGTCFVAASGPHVVIKGERIDVADLPPRAGNRPSIDVLFESACRAGKRAVGVLLSGMGRDGASGLKLLRDAGATTIAQSERTSMVFGMPKAAIDLGAAQLVLDVAMISNALVRAARTTGHGGSQGPA